MLPRSQRLSVEQFNAVMDKGRVTHSSLFLVRSLAVEDSTHVSAVAPQKIFKKSVERHTIRRELYKAIEPFMSELKQGFYVVIIAKIAVKDASDEQITDAMRGAFVKAGLFQ